VVSLVQFRVDYGEAMRVQTYDPKARSAAQRDFALCANPMKGNLSNSAGLLKIKNITKVLA
jgi:hypothetical protein